MPADFAECLDQCEVHLSALRRLIDQLREPARGLDAAYAAEGSDDGQLKVAALIAFEEGFC